MCRVRSLLRRAAAPDALRTGRTSRVGPLEIDEAALELRVEGIRVALRPREFALIALLATHPGVAMPRRQLIEHVWGSDYDGDERTVDGHIARIRRQLSKFAQIRCRIESIYGYGYKFAIA